jgi:hypothetical protein
LLIDIVIFGYRKEIKEAAEMFLRYKDFAIEIQDKSDTSNNWGNWKYLNIILKI